MTRIGINFDLTDERPGREREIDRVKEGCLFQTRLHAFGQIMRDIGRQPDFVPSHRLIGAGDFNLAAFDDDIIF